MPPRGDAAGDASARTRTPAAPLPSRCRDRLADFLCGDRWPPVPSSAADAPGSTTGLGPPAAVARPLAERCRPRRCAATDRRGWRARSAAPARANRARGRTHPSRPRRAASDADSSDPARRAAPSVPASRGVVIDSSASAAFARARSSSLRKRPFDDRHRGGRHGAPTAGKTGRRADSRLCSRSALRSTARLSYLAARFERLDQAPVPVDRQQIGRDVRLDQPAELPGIDAAENHGGHLAHARHRAS